MVHVAAPAVDALDRDIACPAEAETVQLRAVLAQVQNCPAFKGSGDITSLSQADGYIEIPADQEHGGAGTLVEVTLF